MLSKLVQALLVAHPNVVAINSEVNHLDHRPEKTGGIKPDVEAGLKRAKDQFGGIEIPTHLSKAVADVNRFIAGLEEAGTLDERDVNISALCNEFLEWLRTDEGIDSDAFDFSRSGQLYRLYKDYSNDMKHLQQHLDDARLFFIKRLRENVEFYRQVDFEGKTPREVLRLAMIHQVVKRPELDLMAKYLTQKEEAQSYYEAQARGMLVPAGPYSAAATFAGLYLARMAECVDEMKAFHKAVYSEYLQKFESELMANGEPLRNPRQDEIDAFVDSVVDPAYTGFASLLNLHFEGHRELIVWKRDGVFTSEHRAGTTAVVMMDGDFSGLTEADIPDTLTFEDYICVVAGRVLKVTEQFQHADAKPVNFGAGDYAAVATVDPAKAKRLKAMKFRKNVWVGGKQTGTVEHVRIYDSGIKVWLTDLGL